MATPSSAVVCFDEGQYKMWDPSQSLFSESQKSGWWAFSEQGSHVYLVSSKTGDKIRDRQSKLIGPIESVGKGKNPEDCYVSIILFKVARVGECFLRQICTIKSMPECVFTDKG